MQQTDKYKFSIIETSDTFSPDALNANARTAEAQLAALEKADAALAAADAALEKTAAANKTALEKALADQKTALEKADATNKTALEKALADQKTALEKADATNKSALEAADAAIRKDLGSGGSNVRISTGSFTGTGSAQTLTFPFNVQLVVIHTNFVTTSLVRGGASVHSTPATSSTSYITNKITWADKSVSFSGDLTTSGRESIYMAFGVG